jgi:hypothetical protein
MTLRKATVNPGLAWTVFQPYIYIIILYTTFRLRIIQSFMIHILIFLFVAQVSVLDFQHPSTRFYFITI